jgi:hypothetical protein
MKSPGRLGPFRLPAMSRRRVLKMFGVAGASGVLSGGFPGRIRAAGDCEGDFCIDPALAAAYEEAEGEIYLGLPISAAVRMGSRLRQYFEKGVLELDLLTGLAGQLNAGQALVQHRLPFPRPAALESDDDHLFFPDTGYNVSFGFKLYYERHNGAERLGIPISPAMDEGFADRPQVQYFARGRLEWHPEFEGLEELIQLGSIGPELLRLDQQSVFAPTRAPLAFGMQVHTWHAPEPQLVTWRSAIAGATWVKHQVKWSDVEPTETAIDWSQLDAFVGAAEQFELKILVSIVEAPGWTRAAGGAAGRPDDLGKFEHFVRLMAERYRGRVLAYEIWNEPNLALFWGRDVDYGEYAELLMAGYRGVKAADPFALVLFAGLAQNGAGNAAFGINDVEFLRGVYAYKGGLVRNFFDVMGNHSYGYRSSPWVEFDDFAHSSEILYLDHPSFYFKRFRQIRRVMEEFDDGRRPMWLTEFGWTTANQHIDFPFGDLISDELQARYTVEAYRMVEREFPYIQNMFLFNLNFRTLGRPETSEHGFGVLETDYSPRPAFTSVQQMDKSVVSPGRIG